LDRFASATSLDKNKASCWAAFSAASAASLAKIEASKEKNEDEKKIFTRQLRTELSNKEYGKLLSNYNTSKRAADAIHQYAKKPTGYSDYASLTNTLKALQGDQSVVKEAELRLGKDAASFFDKINNYIDQAASGKSLQPSQRKDMEAPQSGNPWEEYPDFLNDDAGSYGDLTPEAKKIQESKLKSELQSAEAFEKNQSKPQVPKEDPEVLSRKLSKSQIRRHAEKAELEKKQRLFDLSSSKAFFFASSLITIAPV